MKTIINLLMLLMMIGIMPSSPQTSNRKAEREKKRIEKENKIAVLVDAKTFEFRADRAIPTGFGSVDLTTNPNYVKFTHEQIECEMPFFGRAYSVAYIGEGGFKFKGKPEIYTVEKKKNNILIEAKIKGNSDYFTINLTVSPEGSATMSISSNNRSPISYNGEIFASEKQEEK